MLEHIQTVKKLMKSPYKATITQLRPCITQRDIVVTLPQSEAISIYKSPTTFLKSSYATPQFSKRLSLSQSGADFPNKKADAVYANLLAPSSLKGPGQSLSNAPKVLGAGKATGNGSRNDLRLSNENIRLAFQQAKPSSFLSRPCP